MHKAIIALLVGTGLGAAFFLPSMPALAQSQGTSEMTLTLDQPTITAAPGGDVLFTGFLTNTPTDVNSTGDTLTIGLDTISNVSPSNVNVDDSPYYSGPGAPGFDYFFFGGDTLGPNESTSDLDLFYVDVPSDASAGETITGDFAVDYYDSAGNYYQTTPDLFTVIVEQGVTAVPEMSGLVLTLLGLGGLGLLVLARGVVRRRRSFVR